MARMRGATAVILGVVVGEHNVHGGVGELKPIHALTQNVEAVSDGSVGMARVHVRMESVTAPPSAFDPVYQLQFYSSAGAPIGSTVNVAPADVAEVVGDGDFDIEQGEIWRLDLTQSLQIATNAWSFDVLFREANGDVDRLHVAADGFPGLGDDSDAVDTLYIINRQRPRLVAAYTQVNLAQPNNSTLLLGFSMQPLGPGSAAPNALRFANFGAISNPFDTPQSGFPSISGSLALLTPDDFELADDADFTVNIEQLEALLAGRALFDGQQFLSVRYDSQTPQGDLNGKFIRIDELTSQVRDGTGQLATGSVLISPFQEFSAISAAWIRPVAPGEQDVLALRVTFNHPVRPLMPGDVTFFSELMLAGGATDLAVDMVQRDPDDPFSVLLRLDSGGSDGVDHDGLSTTGGLSYTIALDAAAGTPTVDVFDTSFPAASNNTLVIGDAIEDPGCGPIPGDANGDAVVDIIDLNLVLGNFGQVCEN